MPSAALLVHQALSRQRRFSSLQSSTTISFSHYFFTLTITHAHQVPKQTLCVYMCMHVCVRLRVVAVGVMHNDAVQIVNQPAADHVSPNFGTH